MTIHYLPHERPLNFKTPENDPASGPDFVRPMAKSARSLPIIDEKLRIPSFENIVTRPRLNEMLERATDQSGATLVCGRAGMGKTVFAADYAAKCQDSIWYSIEAADYSWDTFSTYFYAALGGDTGLDDRCENTGGDEPLGPAVIVGFLATCMDRLRQSANKRPIHIVLDNIHHLYDAVWFPEFFKQLILSLAPNVRVIMLCRSKPPVPLWRLRSKQMLQVIDEGVLGFTPSEATRLSRLRGFPRTIANQAHRRSSGRVSKLIESLDEISTFSP